MTTLDDVIGLGKNANIVEPLMEEFGKDNSKGGDLVLTLARLDGLDKREPEQYAALEQTALNFSPALIRAMGEEYIQDNARKLVEGVKEPRGVIGRIKPKTLKGYLLDSKPVRYEGAGEVLGIHERANRAKGILENEESLKEEAGKYVDGVIIRLKGKVNNAILIALREAYSMRPDIAIRAVQKMALSDIKRFEGLDEGTLANYASGRYNALGKKEKPAEVYKLGRLAAA